MIFLLCSEALAENHKLIQDTLALKLRRKPQKTLLTATFCTFRKLVRLLLLVYSGIS